LGSALSQVATIGCAISPGRRQAFERLRSRDLNQAITKPSIAEINTSARQARADAPAKGFERQNRFSLRRRSFASRVLGPPQSAGGTGYSSLSYLKRFPFDKIKFDRCFVSDIAEVEGSSAIVQAVVNIASARNMTTTAEGVETEQQRQRLRALGCTEMQGYLFSAAKPGPEVRRLLGGGQVAAEVA
jgi:hypothetical protein